MEHLEVIIKGMTCDSCKKAIERHFTKLNIKTTVDLVSETGFFEYDPRQWQVADILENIKVVGYKPTLEYQYQKNWQDYYQLGELVVALLFTFILMLPMLVHINLLSDVPALVKNGYFQLALATFIQFGVGRHFYRGMIHNIKNKTLGVDVLISLSTTIAYLYSLFLIITIGPILPSGQEFFFDVSGEIITFLLIGKIIEKKFKQKAANQLKLILSRQAKDATLVTKKIVAISALQKGDVILIRKGERIPVDAIVSKGKTTVDESLLTGESLPVLKQKNDQILGGTINTGSGIEAILESDPQKSQINQIVASIKKLQQGKAPIARFADTISNYFVPTVIIIIIITFLSWNYGTNIGTTKAMINAIAVAVVACPCALGLATPMSISSGAARAIQEGILYHQPDVFEKFKKIEVVAFDKTGTITKGELVIEKIIGNQDLMNEFVSLEIISMHPIAQAFMNYKHDHKAQFKDIEFSNFQEIIGSGVAGKYQNQIYRIGSYQYIKKHATFSKEQHNQHHKLLAQGFVVVIGAVNKQVVSLFALSDEIKESSQSAIAQLKAQGIATIMITGDNKLTAAKIAAELGIDEVHSQIKPLHKAKIIRDLKASGKVVAFAGDGVNDAVALQEADLAIAMGSGSDLAMANADLTLLNSDISSISKALKISNQTLGNIKQNLVWAFAWNGTMIPIAAFGFMAPWIAALAMSVESIIVILNATRLRFIKFTGEGND